MIEIFSLFTYFLLVDWIGASDIGCNTHATILRQLEKEGFHIDVHSLVELVVDIETASKWENCSLLLRENIPDSFYVNSDQLSELSRSGISQACTTEKIDVEAPQHLSKSHNVFVYGQFKKSQNLIYSHLNLPVHLRYQKPKIGGGFSSAELKSPVLLIRCPNVDCKNLMKSKAPCSLCGSELCVWTKFPYKTNNNNITLSVPVGDLNHLWFVSSITYMLTFGGCTYILIAVVIASKEYLNTFS